MNSLHQQYRNPLIFLAILAVGMGLFAFSRMQTALFPEVMFPKVKLIADVGQTPIDRMMVTVTRPIESAVKRVKGVTVVKSVTSRGSSDVQIYFEWGIDVDQARLQIESRLGEIRNLLPPGTNIAVEGYTQSLFPVYGYTLESKSYGPVALRDIAMNTVRPLFSQVPGISTVILRGGKAKEFVLVPDLVKMSTLGITPARLIDVFNNTNYVLANGRLSDYRKLYLSLTDTRLGDADDLSRVVVKSDSGRVVLIRDIARVELREQVEFNIINTNGHEGMIVDLVKQPGVNLIDFAKTAEDKAAEIRSLLPAGVELKPYYNQSAFVGDSIQSVVHTILEGLLLAIVVVILFLRSARASAVVILTLPVTLGLTAVALYASGVTLNIMSLGGIAAAVGLFIDDAIVVVEQIYRGHEVDPQKHRFTVVKEAIHELFPAMVGSSLSTIVIFLPFVLMGGLAGAFFKELAKTMELTLVCSFFVTWLITPVLHLLIGYRPHYTRGRAPATIHSLGDDATEDDDTLVRLRWLTWLYRRPVYALIFLALLIFAAFWAGRHLTTGFLPELDEGTIVLDFYSPPGTALEETDRLCREVEKVILADPDVASYSRRTGLRLDFRNVAPNYGDYLIQLKRYRSGSTPQVIARLRTAIQASVPVMNVSFGQRIQDLLGNLMSTPSPVEIKVFGSDQHELERLGHRVDSVLHRVPGLVDINNGMITAGPAFVYHPDEVKLARYGISLTDFQQQVQLYTQGIVLGPNAGTTEPSPVQASMMGNLQVGQIQDQEQMRKIRLLPTEYTANDIDKIEQEPIFLPDGSLKPLQFFGTVEVQRGEVDLKREDLKSCVVLTARLKDRDLGSVIGELRKTLDTDVPLPPGYYIRYGGAYAEQQQSFRELLTILVAASMLVFTVLLFLFREWGLALLILLLSITGICGSLIALFLLEVPLNVSSYTGLIMIVGIIAENAIFTVNQFRHNRERHGWNADQALDHALATRIRPKLMTAIGAILALLPLALGIGLGAQMQQALAIAVIGGFIAGIPLLLFVFPSLLRLLYK